MMKLAWRNLWRNKRRTIITAASVMFAVFFAILMRGFHKGAWLNLIDSVLHSYSGYVQVHSKGYWEYKTFDYTMAQDDSLVSKISALKEVSGLIPRVESFSLASAGNKTKGVITVGVDPIIEKEFSAIDKKIVSGRYFNNADTGVLLSQRLSKFLGLGTGDSIVLLSQGYQGAAANGIFKIIGIVKLPSPEFDNQMVFMPLTVAQDFYSAYGRVTSYVVDLNNPDKMDKTISKINNIADPEKYEVMSWEQMLVELYQQYVSDEGGGVIMLALLYLIVGFGVFGTILMMIAERKREFSIMVTVGMQRIRLVQLVAAELIYICFIGVVAGVIVSAPIIIYFHFNPIEMTGDLAKTYQAFGMEPLLPVAWQTDYIIQQAINVSIIVLVVLFYPLYSVYKLKVYQNLRK